MRVLGHNQIAMLCRIVAAVAAFAASASAGEPLPFTSTDGGGWSLPALPVPPLLAAGHSRPEFREFGAGTASPDLPSLNERRRLIRFAEVPPPQTAFPPPRRPPLCEDGVGGCETWQILPAGLLFRSYLAGEKEPRMGTALLFETDGDTLQESALGARVGLIRYGTPGGVRPEGWQLDIAGAAFLRQNWTHDLDVDAVDFRIGVPLTWRRGPWAAKFGYYHLSSHVGDEFLVRNPGFQRINFVRDALLFGLAYDVTPDWLVYGEVAYAVNTDGGAEPWEFQFGVEYSPVIRSGLRGSPFFAVNGHLREEFDFGGSVNILAGWQWRSSASDARLRIGGQYFNGKSMQYSFFNRNEELAGVGIWYDF
ncbi:MAG: DUF1207 domain-containing protein [Planctomycetaceae bacterium]